MSNAFNFLSPALKSMIFVSGLFSERVRHIQESLEQFIESLNNEK